MMTYKITFIGDGCTGKTATVRKATTGVYEETYKPTLGVDVTPITFKRKGRDIRLNIWDCAGDKKFLGLKDGYWLKTNLYVVFYSVSSESSFEKAKDYINELKQKGNKRPVLVVGTKADPDNKERVIDPCSELEGFPCLEISAKYSVGTENFWSEILNTLKK